MIIFREKLFVVLKRNYFINRNEMITNILVKQLHKVLSFNFFQPIVHKEQIVRQLKYR